MSNTTLPNCCGCLVRHSHGITETFDSFDDAIDALREIYGGEIEYTEIEIPEERALVWADSETAEDDDGSRAVASIKLLFAPEEENRVPCECGEYWGNPCDVEIGPSPVEVTVVPAGLRETARAAGTWVGLTHAFPVSRDCAHAIADSIVEAGEHSDPDVGDWLRIDGEPAADWLG